MKFLFLDLSLYVDRAVVEVMSAQGTQGEENPQVGVGHEIPGAEDGAQVIQLTQVQIAQIVSNAVSQALTHQLQQLDNIPSTAAGNNTTHNTVAAQQYQTPIKFDVPHLRVTARQVGRRGVKEFCTRPERVASTVN